MRSVLPAVCSCFIYVVGLTVGHDSAVGDFPELLKQVPDSANTMMLMKSKDIAANASLSADNKVQQFLEAAKNWPVVARWQPERIVIAAEMDIQHMAPAWQMAVIELAQPPDLNYLTRRTGGVADKLMDYDVIWLENACVLRTGEKQLTFVTPLNRQSATRWLRRIKSQTSIAISPYLAEVAQSAASGNAEIVMAIDLENVFPPAEVSKAVANSTLLKKISTDPTSIFCGIRGLTINCRVGANQDSSLNVDFSDSVQSLAPIAQPLMIGALTKAGAMLDEFNNWEVKADGKQISMQGKLSPNGLGRILNIMSINSIASEADAAAVANDSKPAVPANSEASAGSGEAEKTRMQLATKRYFRNVTRALDEIKDRQINAPPEQSALWDTNTARRIEQLSVRNVDPQMIKYGQYVVAALNDMVYGIHQSVNEVRATADNRYVEPVIGRTTVTAVPYRSYNYGGQRRFSYAPLVSQNLNLGGARQQRRSVRDSEVGAANVTALNIMKEIETATAQIRNAMAQKYQTDF